VRSQTLGFDGKIDEDFQSVGGRRKASIAFSTGTNAVLSTAHLHIESLLHRKM
jgi:hypothetical protein